MASERDDELAFGYLTSGLHKRACICDACESRLAASFALRYAEGMLAGAIATEDIIEKQSTNALVSETYDRGVEDGYAEGVKAERARVSSVLEAANETAEALAAVVKQARVSGIEQGRAEALAAVRDYDSTNARSPAMAICDAVDEAEQALVKT